MGDWVLQEYVAAGGNGEIWKVKHRAGGDEIYALKVLKREGSKTLGRFTAEITALRLMIDVPGIVPLVDQESPGSSRAPTWYVMPFASTFSEVLEGRPAIQVVRAFLPLALTLSELHKRDIFHRDIKPANILGVDNRLCFGDFGLVTYPHKSEQTSRTEMLVSKFTMAPEMRRHAKAAHPGPADVYSFAKVLWIGLTGQKEGFDGQYSPTSSLALGAYHSRLYTAPLDELLATCTENDPKLRPTMSEVELALKSWIVLQGNFHTKNIEEWLVLQKSLFPTGMPSSARWDTISSIVPVLRTVSQIGALNHMFFPNGGGFDLEGIILSHEEGWIEMHAGIDIILRPAFLSFESFGEGSVWNYFWLEAEEETPSGVEDAYIDHAGTTEQLYEMGPAEYTALDVCGSGGQEGVRPLTRTLSGAFVIFAKRSWYNLDP